VSPVVMVVGEGFLADKMCERLSSQYLLMRQNDFSLGVPEATDLVLVLHDTWIPSIHQKAEEKLRSNGVPWLRGFVSFGEGVIGPLVYPDKAGCSQCENMRRFIAGRDRREIMKIERKLLEVSGLSHDPWASRSGIMQMVFLVEAEVERILSGEQAYEDGRLLLVNLRTLASSCHRFLPDPLCPVCGRLPEDSPSEARISLQSSRKISPGSYRSRSLDDLSKVLVKDYFDNRTGIINGKMFDLDAPFADIGVNLPFLMGDEGTAGRTHSYTISEMTAILEGLERYCGLSPRGKRTMVHDCYRNIKEQALNPLKVGIHEKEAYSRSDYPFKPFHQDTPMNWVWGYSLIHERPILVPELLAYYSLGYEEGFVYETSNGCALGGSLEEAIFYGIMEVVERDSFLMTWYAKLPLPRLDPFSAEDKELQLMIDRVRSVAGYDLYFYNSTMENGIPSIAAFAKNRKDKGLNLICAAGAHLDPIKAAKSAVHELAGMMLTLDEKFEANLEEIQGMYRDSSLVQKMEDHGMLYGLPEAEERLKFLLDDHRPLRPFAEEFKWKSCHIDLTEDLKEILQVFKRLMMDVIVVNQSTPETLRNGLHCVKVLIPGMLPMTFGHHLTRINGLERVLRVPMELGYTKQPLSNEQLNPHPHPFP
jgi:ribosomal protein S12 methylthiotransferase accessory factor